jgi:membrane-associated phospholipid phosphatase
VELWQRGGVVFFAYVVAAADLLPSIPGSARVRAITMSVFGGGISITASRLAASHPLNVWVFPAVVLYLAYRATGVLFTAPMPRAEGALVALDEALRIDRLARRMPRWLAELLEFAYAGIYTLVMLALVASLWTGIPASRFWTLVLVTDFICFGMLPWIRTRTPRDTVDPTPWRSSFRAINLRLVKAGSIGVNTFPSGHAAEALVAALVLSTSPWWLAAGMFVAAAVVSAGALFGRYHYAGDVLAGWGVAVAVYFLMT